MPRWLLQLLALAVCQGLVNSQPCPDTIDTTHVSDMCHSFGRVCLDQNTYVLYDTAHNPRHAAFGSIPSVHLDNIHMNYYGFGDVWGTEFTYGDPFFRPGTAGEETKELMEPQFSRCTIPMVIYPNYLYNYAEFYMRVVTTLHALQNRGWLDRRYCFCKRMTGMLSDACLMQGISALAGHLRAICCTYCTHSQHLIRQQ